MAGVNIRGGAQALRFHARDPRRRHRASPTASSACWWALGLRQVDAAADDRRAGGDRHRRDRDRRHGGQPRAAEGARHRDGVPELRALSAHDGARQHVVRADAREAVEGGHRRRACRRPPTSSASRPYLDRYPRQLSGGQRQRVAMGRAIVRDPQVFLFDEPLSNLDAKLRVQMRTEIKELHQRLKTTSIYVTHDQIEAMTMADKIVVMRDGIVEQTGGPLDLYDHPVNTFVAGFIGSPAMNIIPGTARARRRRARRRVRRRRRAAGARGRPRRRRPAGALRPAARALRARRRRPAGGGRRRRADRRRHAALLPLQRAGSHGDDRRSRRLPPGRPDQPRARSCARAPVRRGDRFAARRVSCQTGTGHHPQPTTEGGVHE